MNEASRTTTQAFQDARASYIGAPVNNPEYQAGMMLAVGFLLGAGMPYAAAAVAMSYEELSPDTPVPWSIP